ncbi:MAG: hypothetical protein KAV87_59405 [Desulfobacteraceae bacterium]|nr:hypothetical protein [Desulfobacteraceae bacterium]
MTILLDEAKQMVQDCEEREGRMSDWERGFISDMQGRIAANYWFTDKQKETIFKIWEKVTENG